VAAFRSGLEEKLANAIRAAGIKVYFEVLKLPYIRPESRHNYTPDFILPNGIVIESKGLLTTEDKQKMKLVKAQHPNLDIRMVFQNANARIAKQSKTTYAKWAESQRFPWAHRDIPDEWLREKANPESLEALSQLGWNL
jgi:hypothetical protein